MQKINTLLCQILAIATVTQAGLITLQPATTSIVHNAPSAISHQSFTRLTSEQPVAVIPKPHHSYGQAHELATTRILANPNYIVKPVEVHVNRHEPALEQHTPAHLTYAARPVVHMTLPHIKPVRKISYESLMPGPRRVVFQH